MKKILLVISLIATIGCNQCGGNMQVVQTGLSLAQTLLQTISAILVPSIAASRALCEEKTKEDSDDHAKARFECASITDAWRDVEERKNALTNAMENGESETEIDRLAKELQRSVDELNNVMAESPTVSP